MPHMIPYYLTFKGGLHIGRGADNLTVSEHFIPADTLFAALVDTWRRLGGDVNNGLLKPFCSDPPAAPFRLTSAFPFAGKVRFYPLPPNLGVCFSPEVLKEYGKRIKRIRYISEGVLKKAQAGESLDAWLFPEGDEDEPRAGVALQGGALWLLKDEVADLPETLRWVMERGGVRRERPLSALREIRLWREQKVPHVTVDRIRYAPNLYHTGQVVFRPGCGLWFGLSWDDDKRQDYRVAVERIFEVLREEGLGGKRSIGSGALKDLRAGEAFTLPDPTPGQAALLLSRYHPRDAELRGGVLQEPAAYNLVAVGGWAKTPGYPAQRRKRVWLLSEGSLIRWQPEVSGTVVDVQPLGFPHPVYRYGLVLATAWPTALSA